MFSFQFFFFIYSVTYINVGILVIQLHRFETLTQTLYCTLHTTLCTLYTAHCTLHTTYCTLHTVHCTLHIAHYKLHTTHCTLNIEHCLLHTTHCTLYTAHCTQCRDAVCWLPVTSGPLRQHSSNISPLREDRFGGKYSKLGTSLLTDPSRTVMYYVLCTMCN